MRKFAASIFSLASLLAVQNVAFAACTGSGTTASPYVCSSTAGLSRPDPVGAFGSSTIDASSIPAGSKIQSVKVSVNMSDPSPDDLFLLVTGPSNQNTENLTVMALVGCGSAFSGTLNFADGSPNLPDCPTPTSGSTFEPSANTDVGTDCSDPSTRCLTPTYSAGAPATLNYPQPFGSKTFSSQFHGADPHGTWTMYGYVASKGDGPGTISSWSITIVLATGAATNTTVSASPNPVFTSGANHTATLTATVTSSPSNPTIGTVAFLDNGATIGGCSAVAVNGSGQATCQETFSVGQEGTHIITANYTDSTATFNSSSGTKGLQVDNVTTNPVSGQYCNTGTISVPNPLNEAANPYPSHIYVPLTNAISSLTVTLNTVNTTSGDAGTLDLMLVAPDGTPFVPLNNVDGAAGENPITASNATFTLSDTGVAFPNGGALTNNQTYKSLTFIPAGNWPASQTVAGPPSVATANFAQNIGSATFTTSFAGKIPNGSGGNAGNPWSLFAVSGLQLGSSGTAATIGGWCLNFVTSAGAATTTLVSSNNNPSFTGSSVQFTATVTSSGSPVTQGTVTFTVDGTTAQGPTALSGAGTVTYTTSALAEGTHTVQAFYNGFASTFNVSNGSLSQQVNTATVVSNNNTTFCNPGGISIPATVGNATPYPSRVFVSNVPGTINTVTVNLKGFTMSIPETTDVLLVGPQASSENLVFMSQIGGTTGAEHPVNNINLTFADGSAAAPQFGQLTSGTFSPTTYRTEAFTFGAPAPASPTFSSTIGTGTLASQFAGTVANGAWQLFSIQDETNTGNTGIFSQWCLNFTTNPPVVNVTKSHTGNFTQGQQGAQFSITVSNAGPGPVAGTLTVTDILPSQFTPAATPGTGTDWNCNASSQTITCTNSDSIASGSSYPALTLNVNVAANATNATNHASATGGGTSGTATSNTDNITIVPAPVLSVTKTHTGTFTQGQTAEWDVTVSNTASGSTTSGTVTVQDTLPSGYTIANFGTTAGTWACSGTGTGVASCTTTLAQAGGTSFPVIQIIVNVPGGSPTSVSNTAGAWGGGDLTHTNVNTAATGTDSNVPVVQVATQMVAVATSTPQSTTVGTAFPVALSAVVTDAGNHPVPNVQVTFTAPTGTGIATGTFTGNLTTVMATTNSSGIATAPTFTANSKPGGPYNVTATAASLPTVNFSLTNTTGAAANIAINAGNNQSAMVNTAFATNLQVTVTDSLNNPISGQNVVFTAPATGASGAFQGGTNTITVATNTSGVATAPTFTANGTAGGPYAVSVTAGPATPTSFSLTNTPSTVQITVSTNISGPTVTVDGGAAFTGSQIFTWTVGSSHTIATTSPQANAGTQYVWLNWSDGLAISHSVIAPATATAYTANFKTQYLLTTAVSPSATEGSISPATGYVDSGTIVSVSATANSGYTFTGFSGGLTGTTTPQNLTVSAPVTVTANFAAGATSLGGLIGLQSGPANARVWPFTIGNHGPGIALGAQITSLTLVQTLGAACTPVINTPMPAIAGDIPAQGTATVNVTIDFSSCAGTVFFKATALLSANGGAAKGSIVKLNQTP